MARAGRSGVCFQFAEKGTCAFGAQCKFSHGDSPHQSQSHRNRRIQSTETHLDEFFAEYPAFHYNKSAPATTNFYKLCDFLHYDKPENETERLVARGRFQDALVLQFNGIYGTDVDDLGSWYSLCQVLNIVPIPEELEECRRAVQSTHVNIVDLVDKSGGRVKVFDTVEELSNYTKESGKFFPKENAYAGGVLKFLLRQILNPPRAPTRRVPRRRGRR